MISVKQKILEWIPARSCWQYQTIVLCAVLTYQIKMNPPMRLDKSSGGNAEDEDGGNAAKGDRDDREG